MKLMLFDFLRIGDRGYEGYLFQGKLLSIRTASPTKMGSYLRKNNESFSRIPLSVIDGREEKRTNLDLPL